MRRRCHSPPPRRRTSSSPPHRCVEPLHRRAPLSPPRRCRCKNNRRRRAGGFVSPNLVEARSDTQQSGDGGRGARRSGRGAKEAATWIWRGGGRKEEATRIWRGAGGKEAATRRRWAKELTTGRRRDGGGDHEAEGEGGGDLRRWAKEAAASASGPRRWTMDGAAPLLPETSPKSRRGRRGGRRSPRRGPRTRRRRCRLRLRHRSMKRERVEREREMGGVVEMDKDEPVVEDKDEPG
ncbi:hypothetical protein DAI22_08g081100 [Oryza sativa Japonica Group]|jgi:hypothetical protein|nr:hypothetical protein DAI22_08g081100 [Oryza sativa Japonica Group]